MGDRYPPWVVNEASWIVVIEFKWAIQNGGCLGQVGEKASEKNSIDLKKLGWIEFGVLSLKRGW